MSEKTLKDIYVEIKNFNLNDQKQKEELDKYLLENIHSLSSEEFIENFLSFLVKIKLFNPELYTYVINFLKTNAIEELRNNVDEEVVSTFERFQNKNLQILNNIDNIVEYINIIDNSINKNIQNYVEKNIKKLKEEDIDNLVEAIRLLKNKKNMLFITSILPYKKEDFNNIINLSNNNEIIKQNPYFWNINKKENLDFQEYEGILMDMQIKPTKG